MVPPAQISCKTGRTREKLLTAYVIYSNCNYFLYLLSIFDRGDANIHRRTGGLISWR